MKPDETKSRVHGDKKSRKLDAFLSALLTHPSVEAAAAAAGIGRVTAWRWMRDPVVIARLREASRASMDSSLVLLQAASTEAVECLRRLVRDAENESVRATAAKTILEMGSRMLEIDDIKERLRKLETAAKSRWKGWSDEQRSYAQSGTVGGVNGAA